MGSLEAYYTFDHDDNPVVVTAPEGVDALLEQIRSESSPQAPILANFFVVADPESQILEVGIVDGRGLVRYAGREWPRGVVSINGDSTDGAELSYFYMGHEQPYPGNSEIPLAAIREAVHEFMATGGARPTCVQWQPGLL